MVTIPEQFARTHGPVVLDGAVEFRVWAPSHKSLEVILHLDTGPMRAAMSRTSDGFFEATVPGARPGTHYWFQFSNGLRFPDPASRFQPDGLHGPSEVIKPLTPDEEPFRPQALERWVTYEVHPGSFTPSGDLAAVVPQIPRLAELGINCLQLMPLAAYSGTRNWGYDGVFPHALHHGLGRPEDLRFLVRACHRHGIAVSVDVVLNHLGPEGACLSAYGDYLDDRYGTPWGSSFATGRKPVSNYLIEAAAGWVLDYGVDALRLDAPMAIPPLLRDPFWCRFTKRLRKHIQVVLIGETEVYHPIALLPLHQGGWDFDALWCDDVAFSWRSVHRNQPVIGCSRKYHGIRDLAGAIRDGALHKSGPAKPLRREPRPLADSVRLMSFVQNHDIIGNLPDGARHDSYCPPGAAMCGQALCILSPDLPLLFMGEEWAATEPFTFFVDPEDQKLATQIRRSRIAGFAPSDRARAPDPADPQTFQQCRLTPPTHLNCPRQLWIAALIKLRRRWIDLGLLHRSFLSVGSSESPAGSILNLSYHNAFRSVGLTVTSNARYARCQQSRIILDSLAPHFLTGQTSWQAIAWERDNP